VREIEAFPDISITGMLMDAIERRIANKHQAVNVRSWRSERGLPRS
jgi:hypothetical protein